MRYLTLVLILSSINLGGCYYDAEDDLYPATDCITTNVSFTNDIKPILTNSCLSCHNALSSIGGGIILEEHTDVLVYALDGSLVGSVKHDNAYSAMPQSATKLDDCKISKIDAWVKEGSLNN